ncbi:glucose dehydrogenase [FAD, quinone]-like [Galendromus occidentalis]|uniref:Glucose dehydrogenase [FAD, quinone]-like n=1 Tax=Galendromus occidentalis TaxID=34638 RepID=A0AAJ6VXP6_9ACAR|nr:glucose dehydrogenase [FAD, quinone]-like [Galendromus occidentalis]
MNLIHQKLQEISTLVSLTTAEVGYTTVFPSPADLKSAYDFIIVGGVITGCLIAKRLSDAGHSTLLIHGPGSLPNELTRVPLLNLGLHGNPDHDHLYKSPRLNSRWLNQTLTYNSGKDLGGSQVLSAQMWSYGKSGDFTCWKEEFGISEKFSNENIRAAGKIHEKASAGVEGVDSPYGESGEIDLSLSPTWAPYQQTFADRFEAAAASLTQTRVNKDQNSDALGFGRIIHAVEADTGYISTPVRAFFENRPLSDNLHIVTRHMVRKILFDMSTSPPRATGVEFVQAEDREGSVVFFKKATKRIILTAGAIRTPQLLALSGVGSESDLKQWNIEPVVTRNGVGQNLHDHYDIGNAGVCFPKGTKKYVDFGLTQYFNFGLHRRGQLRAPLGTQSYGFFKSDQSNLTTSKHYFSIGISKNNLYQDFYLQGKSSEGDNFFGTLFKQRECLLFTPTLLHPEYRGQITLTSGDPLDDPIVDLKTTSNARDMKLIGELWQKVKRIAEESFGDIGGEFDGTPFPACVQDLMIADASILPCPTSGHMLPTISAMAEMAAREVIRDFEVQRSRSRS